MTEADNFLASIDKEILNILLQDKTTNKNIIWATDNYVEYGEKYGEKSNITIDLIVDKNIIKPRVYKQKEEQRKRTKEKAEVFTPSWVCNLQNNLIDNDDLGYEGAFNKELEKSWETTKEKIEFKNGKTWEDYITDTCLEITCGEAPYLASRYDMASGDPIDIHNRIGRLDRKIRVINENVHDKEEWIEWVIKAYKSIYGYEWQGDSLIIARCNLLLTLIEYYKDRYNEEPSKELQEEIANILVWNIWQMDGLKYVVPNSCHEQTASKVNLFDMEELSEPCPGCERKDVFSHNGIYCNIMNWERNKVERFVDSLKTA